MTWSRVRERGGRIVAINPNPPAEVVKWIEAAQKQSEADAKALQSLSKHKVASYILHPEDPCPSSERLERSQFEEFCRSAASDCRPYAERLVELCSLGLVALAPRDGVKSRDPAFAVLEHLLHRIAPVLERLVEVEGDLELLGWGNMVLRSRAPAEEVNLLQSKFHHQAQQAGVLPRSWIHDKLPCLRGVVDQIGKLLFEAREWYQRDCELFESAARANYGVAAEQMQWLQSIRARTKVRVDRIDTVLTELNISVYPCLDRLGRTLESEQKKHPSSSVV